MLLKRQCLVGDQRTTHVRDVVLLVTLYIDENDDGNVFNNRVV